MQRILERVYVMLVFLFKLIASPLLLGGVSLAGRRWGPAVSGWLVGLPLTSAPVLLFVGVEHGRAAVVAGAQGVLLGGVAVAAFCLAVAHAAGRWPWGAALAAGLAAYLAVAWLSLGVVLPIPWACAVVAASLILVLVWLPPPAPRPPAVVAPRWDLPLRMLLAASIVVTLTAVVPLFGPRVVGLLSSFPAFVTILCAFALHQQGAVAAQAITRGVVLGLFAFVAFYLVVGLVVVAWGLAAAFVVASLAAFAVQGASLLTTTRPPAPGSESVGATM
jgi:hypothetical protein